MLLDAEIKEEYRLHFLLFDKEILTKKKQNFRYLIKDQPATKPARKKVRKSTKQKVPGPLAGPLQVAPLDAIPNPVPTFAPQNDLDFPFASGTWGYEADSSGQYTNQIMPNYGYDSVASGVQQQQPHFDNYMGNIFYGKSKSKTPAHVCNYCGSVFKTARLVARF